MSDTTTAAFDPASLLYGSLDKSPTDFAASFAPAATAAPVNAALMPDPDDAGGQDPANPVPATDPGTYDLLPDSAVTAPEEATPAPAAETAPEPAPAAEPIDLAPVFEQALADYNAVAQAAQEAAQKLADLQENAEGIAEFTPEMAAAAKAESKAEAAAERAFEEIADDSITLAIQNYPELADDSHPATFSTKNLLEMFPGTSSKSPTAIAELSTRMAGEMRANPDADPAAIALECILEAMPEIVTEDLPKYERLKNRLERGMPTYQPAPKSPAVPVSQPQPAPGPVPAKAPAAPASSSVAMAQRPAPGQPATPDIVAQVKAAVTAEGGLAGLFGSVLGNRSNAIRMS